MQPKSRVLFALLSLCGLLLSCNVAHATSCGNGGSSNTAACTLSVSAGDSILVFINHSSGVTIQSVTDTESNSYATDIADTSYTINSTTYDASLYRTSNAASSGSESVTVTLSATTTLSFVVVDIGNGFQGGFDTNSAIATGTGTAVSSANISPAENGELVLGWVYSSTTGLTVTWTGMSGVVHYNIAGGTSWGADVTQGTVASIGVTATLSASNPWATYIAAYKPTAAGACSNPGLTSGGSITVPTAGSTVVRLKNGSFGTVDCSTVSYFQPTVGNFGTK